MPKCLICGKFKIKLNEDHFCKKCAAARVPYPTKYEELSDIDKRKIDSAIRIMKLK